MKMKHNIKNQLESPPSRLICHFRRDFWSPSFLPSPPSITNKMCKIVFNISPLFLISMNLSSVWVFSFSHVYCLLFYSLFSAEVEPGLSSCICICICLLSAIKSICFWSRAGAAMYVCVYCVVRARLNLSRLEIIWKCSPSPLGTFHYLSRLSRFHTSTSNTVLIITKLRERLCSCWFPEIEKSSAADSWYCSVSPQQVFTAESLLMRRDAQETMCLIIRLACQGMGCVVQGVLLKYPFEIEISSEGCLQWRGSIQWFFHNQSSPRDALGKISLKGS